MVSYAYDITAAAIWMRINKKIYAKTERFSGNCCRCSITTVHFVVLSLHFRILHETHITSIHDARSVHVFEACDPYISGRKKAPLPCFSRYGMNNFKEL